MSTLKVNKLRDTAGSTDAITLDPNGGAVLAGVTTMTTARVTSGIVTNTFIVGAGVTISESGIEASGIGITCANINGTQIGGRRNIIINGAMNVAQRGTSSTTSGYQTCDRWYFAYGGTDEAPTQAQADVAAGTTPYTSGFRKSFKVTNGNQTGGAGAGDYIVLYTALEAQDIANSGWNYTSTSSYITLSFWAKSSVAKTFDVKLTTNDGTAQQFNHKFALSANTWTKITKTIPGNSNLTFNNDNGKGLEIQWDMFSGTTYTSGSTVDQWVTYNGYTSAPDQTSDWYTTNDATFELTGIQLEVGSQATPFEHRSFGEELGLCQRYYCTSYPYGVTAGSNSSATVLRKMASGNGYDDIANFHFPTEMRAVPTMVIYNPFSGTVNGFRGDSGNYTGVAINTATTRGVNIYKNASVTATVFMSVHATASAEL